MHRLILYHRKVDVSMSQYEDVEQILQVLCAEPPEGSQEAVMTAAFMKLMDEMPGGFLIYYADRGEKIVYANRSLLRIFQCDTMEEFREHTNNSFRGLVYPDDLDEVEESICRQIEASQFDLDYVEYRIRRRDGEIRWIEDYGHFVHTQALGDIFYVFLGDATEKHDQMLAEKNRILAESLKRANLAIESKNTFLSNMSHDMRTPLNAIFGFTSLAKLNLTNPAEALEYLEQVEVASRKLLDMIEKVLAVSELSSQADIEEAPCELPALLQEVADSVQTQAQQQKINLCLDWQKLAHPFVYTDAAKLKQLLLHLLENALAYNKPGGQVWFSVVEEPALSAARLNYRFVVRDTGIGISQEDLERIFEPFTRVKNSTQSGIQAIGLGLSISKSLANLLGGQIEVQSTLGQGSTFTVKLSLRPQERQAQEERQDEAASLKPVRQQRILLVEDNEINREIETEILQRMGFAVQSVENGQQAVAVMQEAAPEDFDLVLLDLQMPVMDGWQAAQKIRALPNPQVANLPIIALSAQVSAADQRRSHLCGINAHLLKPMDLPLLRQTILEMTAKK